MSAAQSRTEYVEAWETFLNRIEKVWAKAGRECEDRPGFESWQGRYKNLRRQDELLRYLQQARNADQHSIQPLTGFKKAVVVRGIPPGGSAEISLDLQSEKISVIGDAVAIEEGPVQFVLLPVKNRDVVFQPPTCHLGQALSDQDPLAVGRQGLEFYCRYVRDAEQRFFSPGA